MVEKMSSDSGNRATNALHRRAKAISDWEKSATAKEKPLRLPTQFTIKFDQGTVFLSAVASGDIEETKKLLDGGVDIDYSNVDGLTALHQACIDENNEMVKLLLDRGANIEARDNEGWTPLHAAASAGNVDIAQILIDSGADLAAVNNEGEVPLDLAEEEEMEDFLTDEIDAKNLEVEEARNEEERVMLEDANSWLNQNNIEEVLDWQGATALHVAAAKGYNKVISLLLQIASIDVNVRDVDGWTPLHAAVHWGSKTATELLTEAGANFDLKNINGQTPCDLAEPEFVKTAENCRKRSKEIVKKPNLTNNKRIDVNTDVNDNAIQEKELQAIDNLKKNPTRSSLKGGRYNAQNGISTVKTNIDINIKTTPELDESDESDTDSKPSTTVVLNGSKPDTVVISSKTSPHSTGDSKNLKVTSVTSRVVLPKKDTAEATESKTEETSRPSISSRTKDSELTESKQETSRPSISSRTKDSDVTESKQETSRPSISSRTKDSDVTESKQETSRPSLSSRTKDSDVTESKQETSRPSLSRTKVAEVTESKKEEPLQSSLPSRFNRPYSIGSSGSKTEEKKNEVGVPSKFRSVTKNEKENEIPNNIHIRTSVPRDKDPPNTDENDSTTTTSATTSATDASDNSRLSIADRLRKKNELLIASSTTSDRNSSSSYTDRYTNSRSDRDSSSGAASSLNKSVRLTTTTNSSDTGDTKELQRKLDQALKDVQDYKSKYDKMKQEKEELEAKLEQYKEDIDKMQELKNDNLRLKDENGALIRVISKLSRTPAS